ncbi:hypothetical protein GWI33_005476 [Rhynchophorus ferrugineus]|uniref:Uncharacterized protein n=1 Tax=Rhynchophorus ferrugineus TaxID=354439 RepID=A0A834IGL4_RHYFE|nr:hypothetical protein GWI33_005476 [Rhynchophorus ferrugineus]
MQSLTFTQKSIAERRKSLHMVFFRRLHIANRRKNHQGYWWDIYVVLYEGGSKDYILKYPGRELADRKNSRIVVLCEPNLNFFFARWGFFRGVRSTKVDESKKSVPVAPRSSSEFAINFNLPINRDLTLMGLLLGHPIETIPYIANN